MKLTCPGFPLFALFNAAMGVTTVIPEMDPTKPAQVDPERIITAIRDQGVTQAFGSPAMWNRIGRYCDAKRRDAAFAAADSLRGRSGASARPGENAKDADQPNGADVHTPYGATESLPVCSISGREVLEETAAQTAIGTGTCVGHPFPQLQVKVAAITEGRHRVD